MYSVLSPAPPLHPTRCLNVGAFLAGALSMLTPLLHAESPRIVWRQQTPNQIQLQVQSWNKSEAPVALAKPLNPSGKPFEISEFQAMESAGFWQLQNYDLAKTSPGLYRLSLKGVEPTPENDSLLQTTGVYESVRGTIDHAESRVVWNQTRLGAARILLQFPSGMTIASPGGWQLYPPGEAALSLDLNEETGINYSFHPSLAATVQIAPFSKDLLFIPDSEKETTIEDHFKLPDLGLPNQQLTFQAKALSASGKAQKKLQAGGLLQITLDPKTIKFLDGRRYEILLYLDGEFLHEESQGVSPYLYLMPETLPQSSNSLTINLLNYEGNWGVQTMNIQTPSSK